MNGADFFRSIYNLAFQVTPIILTGGNYTFPLPIIALVGQLEALIQGIATNSQLSETDFFATYLPVPGSTTIQNAIATYPFANQQVAANAIIQQPLNISLTMIAPVRDTGGYLSKLAILTSLVNSLQSHNNAGGTYDILTPGFTYFDCVMTGMQDVTPEDQKQKQIIWQLDFVQPLISTADANAAFSNQMNKIANGGYLTTNLPSGIGG